MIRYAIALSFTLVVLNGTPHILEPGEDWRVLLPVGHAVTSETNLHAPLARWILTRMPCARAQNALVELGLCLSEASCQEQIRSAYDSNPGSVGPLPPSYDGC